MAIIRRRKNYMEQMILKGLYYGWQVILAVDVILGVAAFRFPVDTNAKKKKRKVLFSAIGVLSLVAGASAGVYLSHTIVPNVTGLSSDSTIKSIRENGLIDELKTNHPYDPSSIVVGQSPVHGWIVKKNSMAQYWNEESPSQILHNNQPVDDNSGNTPDGKPTDHVIVPDVVGELQSEATTIPRHD